MRDEDYQRFLRFITYATPDQIAKLEAPEKYQCVKDGSHPLLSQKQDTAKGVKNDYYSVYAYGETLKIVYHKIGIIEPKKPSTPPPRNTDTEEKEGRFSSSLSRAKARVFELAACNEFQYFCTFTQDQTKRDRYDLQGFRKDLAQFFRNLNRGRKEKIKYLLIPEEHKKGGFHLHGLLKGLTADDLRPFTLNEKIPVNIKNQLKNGKKVYDFTRYRSKFGYFTCTEIEDGIACSKYITKYITKDLVINSREKNAHLFYASQGLKGRECLVYNSFDVCPYTDWDYENQYIKVKTIDLRK